MALSDIAAGLEVTTEQRERGVATVDRTATSLADRLAAVAGDLPCDAESAATLVEAYAEGASVGDAGRAAGVPPVTAAKALYLLGEPVDPLGPTGQAIVADWVAGEIGYSDARQLAGVGEREFALAAYVHTHDPIPDARAAVEGALTDRDATGEKRAALGDALETGEELR
jgi:hypothetical protein